MGKPNLLVKRNQPLEIIHVEALGTAMSINQYEEIKITKTGYLWGYLRLVLIEGQNQKLVKENLGYIEKGYKIESVTKDLIILKKPKAKRVLSSEFVQDKKAGTWQRKR